MSRKQETEPECLAKDSEPDPTHVNSYRGNLQQPEEDGPTQVPESAILVVCHPCEQQQTNHNTLPVSIQTTVPQLLGDLIEKGVARKFYLSITLEHHVKLEALVDTGADITLMSTQLLEEIQERTKRTSGTLRLQKCALNVQAYSHTGLRLEQVAPVHLTVRPMSLIHPVYISPLDTYPLLTGKDLLNRFEPLIDFKQLKIWAQVREPLPFHSQCSTEVHCQVTDTGSSSLSENASPRPRQVSNLVPHGKSQTSLLCAFKTTEPSSNGFQLMTFKA